jgi:hypothetical protein
MVFRFTLLFSLLIGACMAAEPAPEDAVAQARSFIAALGADSYMERAQAKESLIKLGRPAIEPLEAASQDEDPELRLRALEILIALRGRGFMGIGLSEDTDTFTLDADGEPVVDEKDEKNDKRSAVTATKVLDYKADRYEEMYGVTRQFAAAAAGMVTGDRVTFVNDRPVRGIKDLMREVVRCGPGRVASITIERDGKEIRLPMRLTRNPMLAGNQFGGKEPPPPVDMEKEGFEGEPKTAATAPVEAATPVEKKRPALSVDYVDPFEE